jgi:hypothetical protein
MPDVSHMRQWVAANIGLLELSRQQPRRPRGADRVLLPTIFSDRPLLVRLWWRPTHTCADRHHLTRAWVYGALVRTMSQTS